MIRQPVSPMALVGAIWQDDAGSSFRELAHYAGRTRPAVACAGLPQGGGGSPLSAPLELPSGLVTFLITDIEGSTRLAQLLGNEYRPVLAEPRASLLPPLGGARGVRHVPDGG